jgi:hypothetical protein
MVLMPKYKGTYTLELTLDINAPDLNTAQQELRAHVSLQGYPTKVISVIRSDADMEKACPACVADKEARAQALAITWAHV